ncbi:hypothetical protein [Mycetocola tolaasinivorans]|uniref:hypothetical protein n=1 Tax=Mycetocola tolaasinivorans TaxID=76635 RepID=UPI0011C3DB79|nr:hypothetical protein [Mycetocola tolaasinivorans]
MRSRSIPSALLAAVLAFTLAACSQPSLEEREAQRWAGERWIGIASYELLQLIPKEDRETDPVKRAFSAIVQDDSKKPMNDWPQVPQWSGVVTLRMDGEKTSLETGERLDEQIREQGWAAQGSADSNDFTVTRTYEKEGYTLRMISDHVQPPRPQNIYLRIIAPEVP